MTIKRIDAQTLNVWVNSLAEKQKIIGVQARGDYFAFAPLMEAADLRLDYDVTVLPPKSYLQPSKETILSFNSGEGYESVIEAEPSVLIGVHPYDMVAIAQMDEVFSQQNQDIQCLGINPLDGHIST
ncbi:hypothetical protein ACFLTK_04400, partial [Chloroflexota bacterium]